MNLGGIILPKQGAEDCPFLFSTTKEETVMSQGKKLDKVLVRLNRATVIINFLKTVYEMVHEIVHDNWDWIRIFLSNLSG